MAINTNLLAALQAIISQHGGVETLSDARRVRALLAAIRRKRHPRVFAPRPLPRQRARRRRAMT
jgi:hypothetical protein